MAKASFGIAQEAPKQVNTVQAAMLFEYFPWL
jgi:hypothetical protein